MGLIVCRADAQHHLILGQSREETEGWEPRCGASAELLPIAPMGVAHCSVPRAPSDPPHTAGIRSVSAD